MDSSTIQYIVKNYKNIRNEDLIKSLNITRYDLISIRKKYNLKKSNDFKSNIMSRTNKIKGRDLNYEILKEIALKYKTRGEFQPLDPSAYTTSRKMNILDDVCSHMLKQSYSLPQIILKTILSEILGDNILYNTRKIINPYELDIYYPDYKLAFEYDGNRWHSFDKIDKKKICENMGITLIKIRENTRIYEEDIKSQLVKNITVLNEKTNLNLVDVDIYNVKIPNNIFDDLYSFDSIRKLCLEYKNYKQFRKENINLYNKIVKLGKLDELTCHMSKTNISKWDLDSIKCEISKYVYLKDFIKGSQGCYLYIIKNNLNYLMNNLLRSSNVKWTEENIINEIGKYKTIREFRENSRSCYGLVFKKNLKHLIDHLEREI